MPIRQPSSCDETDRSPARGVSCGDPDCWVADHGDALLRYALPRVRDLATAEDLVQETLLGAWRGRNRFTGGSSFRTWLIGILKRRIADHYRSLGKERLAPAPGTDSRGPEEFDRHGNWDEIPKNWPLRELEKTLKDSPERLAEHAEFWGVLSRCASDMPEHLAQAFRLRTIYEEGVDSICEQEGITAKNLSVRLHRARLLLRRCLERRWFCEEPKSRPQNLSGSVQRSKKTEVSEDFGTCSKDS